MTEDIIKIDKRTLEKIKEKIEGTEFKSVQDYINYFLTQLVSENISTDNQDSDDEETKLKERMKKLGYLD